MPPKPSITVLGSLNADIVPYVPHHPHPGETITATCLARGPGGKGANQAVACARLADPCSPVHVAMVGAVGDDADGRMLLSSLRESSVDTSAVRSCEGSQTGVAVVIVDEMDKQNRIIVSPEANHELGPGHVLGLEADLLLVQLEIRLETVLAAIRASTSPVLLNAAPAPEPLPRDIYPHITHLIVNESEAATLATSNDGSLLSDEAGLRLVTQRFQDWGVANVVITLGERGVFYAAAGGEAALIPAEEVDVVDTTAAGDTFVGAYALAVVGGQDGRGGGQGGE
ncbi:ribokinase [Ophiocordyceps camponoti-floridani]|uniref:Ribokinase n=1 Tax=Ophiocordyceps camponoti-floridani TaxID=2030778 RepID=A0A8H4Q5Z5_9HYPO|nr:ribokinase [Ophiocordyceps camponoti-floridani]